MYLGVLLIQEKSDGSAKTIVFVAVFVVTIAMAVWIWYKMRAIKKVLLQEQALRKEARMKEEQLRQELAGSGWTVVIGGPADPPRIEHTSMLPPSSPSGRPF